MANIANDIFWPNIWRIDLSFNYLQLLISFVTQQQYLSSKCIKTFQLFFTDNFLRFHFNCCCKLPCFLPVFFSLILHIPSVLNALQVLNFFVDLHGNGQYFSKTFFYFSVLNPHFICKINILNNLILQKHPQLASSTDLITVVKTFLSFGFPVMCFSFLLNQSHSFPISWTLVTRGIQSGRRNHAYGWNGCPWCCNTSQRVFSWSSRADCSQRPTTCTFSYS